MSRLRKLATDFNRIVSGQAGDEQSRNPDGTFGSGGGSGKMSHGKALKSAVLNEGHYAKALEDLKASKPSKEELLGIVKEVTGLHIPSSTPIKTLYERLEKHGRSEQRASARAEVSRKVMPI